MEHTEYTEEIKHPDSTPPEPSLTPPSVICH